MTNRVDSIHRRLLSLVEQNLGRTTTNTQKLSELCSRFFGETFAGVFPSDMIPQMNNNKRYAIINTDKSYQTGEHWLGLYFISREKGILVYDSFGRKTRTILPSLLQTSIDTEYDSEQEISESNCGQRCIAFLLLCKYWDYKLAQKL